jgi:DNA polymerase V
MMNEVQFLTVEIGESVALPYYPEGIRAGFPSPATDYEEESIDLNRELIRHREATFFARVKGDSMIDAGYMPGDLLVVDKSLDPQDGDVVVAYVDGGFTIKELDLSQRDKGIVWLVPHNEAYQRIKISEEQMGVIWGVVTYCIHKSFKK